MSKTHMLELLYTADENVMWYKFGKLVGSFLPYDLAIPLLHTYPSKVVGKVCQQKYFIKEYSKRPYL